MNLLPRWIHLTTLAMVLATVALSGCSVKTTVQVTATTPHNVSHMYVTVKELWFNTDANATPDDGSWTKKVLSSPVTIDLAGLNSGSTSSIDSIFLGGGTYSQLRLVLADSSAALEQSASDLGLSYNDEVQYVDSSGASHIVPLEFPSPDSSWLIPVSIQLNAVSVKSQALASNTSDSTAMVTQPTVSNTSGSGAFVAQFATSTNSDSSAAVTQSTATVTVDVDALRSLILFNYDGQTGAFLSPELHAYSDAKTASITGTLAVSALPPDIINSTQGIVVSAEQPSVDGTHYTVIKSAVIDSSGNFKLFALPTSDSTTYDIVIHGAGIQTTVISGVTVTSGSTTTVQNSAINLANANSFVVNTSSSMPGGTQAGFFQTLSSTGLVYSIESAAVNPFGGGFPSDVGLSSGSILAGTYNDGNLILFVATPAQEGVATYRAVSTSPWRAVSDFSTTFSGATGGSTNTRAITLPQPNLPSNAVAHSIAGTINFGTPGKYNSLYVLVSRGGQLVAALNLSSSLGTQSNVDFSVDDIPGGTANAIYDVAIRAWHSADPAHTVVRTAFPVRADLRSGDAAGLALQL